MEPALAAFQAKPEDDARRKELADKEQAAKKADREAKAGEDAAAAVRARLVDYCQGIVSDARTREDKALGIRKFNRARSTLPRRMSILRFAMRQR